MSKRILAVDDDPVIVEMIQAGLSRYGYQIITASQGREALKKIQEEIPDLVILDIMMPAMDGTEVARTLRENELTRHVPIIFLTVLWEKDDGAMDRNEFGANVVLGKPFKLEDLLEKVRVLAGEPD